MTTAIRGARVVMTDDLVETDILIDNGRIVEIGGTGGADRTIDGRGRILAPAMIDVHGDAFERQVMPRPNVFFPVDAALLETDRQLAANGIATAYHALTLSWEPGLRSVGNGEAFVTGLEKLEPRLTIDNRVQLRWETFAFEAIDLIRRVLKGPKRPQIAFNDHTSMMVRDRTIRVQERLFEHNPDFRVADMNSPDFGDNYGGSAARAGLTLPEYVALLKSAWTRRPDVQRHIEMVAALGQEHGLPMLSHDDTQIETRDWYRDRGVRISEFPMTVEVARSAREAGDAIAFGSPNVVRGGSHIGSPSAADMVEDGLSDMLASDYFYPAMLAAVARLVEERRTDLPGAWAQVSSGPAMALGLSDRGEIAVGKRADLVLVDWPENQFPAIRMTMSAGRTAYLAD